MDPAKQEIFDFIVLRGCSNYYKIVDFDNSALYKLNSTLRCAAPNDSFYKFMFYKHNAALQLELMAVPFRLYRLYKLSAYSPFI